MKQDVDIYFFSGTGNTYLAVRHLADALGAGGRNVNVFHIETVSDVVAVDNRVVGVAFPVAAQGTYPLVWDFINSLPEGNDTEVFMLDTLAGFSGGIVEPLGDIFRKKGYTLLGAIEIIMPSNFLRRRAGTDDDYVLLEKGCQQARAFAAKLVEGSSCWPENNFRAKFFYLVNKVLYGCGLFGVVFSPRVKRQECVSCGLCARFCPVGAIGLDENGKAKIGGGCQACMRCFGLCQHGAITKFGAQPYTATNILEMINYGTTTKS